MFFFKKTKKTIPLIVTLILSLFMTGCYAMKNKPAEKYFSGSQLRLAQAIHEENLNEVQSLLHTTDLNRPAKEDMTLLFYSLLEATSKNDKSLHILSLLVKAGADPVQPVPDMMSVAVFAAKADSPLYLKALLEGGMSADAKYRTTPIIFYTANDETIDNMKVLVHYNADVNATNGVGRTAIMDAIDVMQLHAVEYLLNHGANPNAVNNLGSGFRSKLQDGINEVENPSEKRKLQHIKELAIQKGMK